MKGFVKTYLSDEGRLTPNMDFGISNLILDEAFLTKILSSSYTAVLDKIQYVRESNGKDSFLYYVFEGTVVVLKASTKEYMATIDQGQFFCLSK